MFIGNSDCPLWEFLSTGTVFGAMTEVFERSWDAGQERPVKVKQFKKAEAAERSDIYQVCSKKKLRNHILYNL